MTKFFEDVTVGDRTELGSYTFTPEAIIAFAEKYDPQPFHLSEEGASKTHFTSLCASGWHTAAVFMKLLVATTKRLVREMEEAGRAPARLGPSPGFEKLKWIKPVYAGDTLTYQRVVTGKTECRSRPEWGIMHSDMMAHNQNGELVFSFKANVFVERRQD